MKAGRDADSASLEFTTALHGGAFDGVNEKGLAVAQNYAFVTDSWRPAPLVWMEVFTTANTSPVPVVWSDLRLM